MDHPTRRRTFLRRAIGGLLGLAAGSTWSRVVAEGAEDTITGLRTVRVSSHALGSRVSITALHGSERVARQAINAALVELDRVEGVMSLYRPDSQLCRLNRDGRLNRPDPSLVEVLRTADSVAARTGGAFDVTVQPLWVLYARTQRDGRLPDEAELDRVREKVGYRKLSVGGSRLQFDGDGMAVTLNGIAQGYAADQAAAVLRNLGIEHALIDTGELLPLGAKPDGACWTAGIQHPRNPDAFAAVVPSDGRALSTSGDYESDFSPDHRHHHILDPRTGRSPVAFSSVSVLAPTAIEADALSTALFVLGPARGLALIAAFPGVDALFILKDGRSVTTEGFPAVE